MSKRTIALCLAAAAGASGAAAAPLDALLSASHPQAPFTPVYEAGYDMANRTVDVFGLRPRKDDGSYGPSGNYDGVHLRLGMNLTPALWVDGGLWTRRLRYESVSSDLVSWQLAGQYRFVDGGATGASLALRAGAWGDAAPELRKNTPVTVKGTTYTSATATKPRDAQAQLDLVASWPLRRDLVVSGFVGGGASRVDFDKVSATTQAEGGCRYDLEFTPTNVIASCDSKGMAIRVAVPNAVYGIDVDKEARYTARFANAGVNADWTTGAWRLRGGLQVVHLERSGIDEIVAERGGTPHKTNAIVAAEAARQLLPKTWAFVRAQVMAHQFVGEAPMTYNSLTATAQRRRYGLLTLGVSGSF